MKKNLSAHATGLAAVEFMVAVGMIVMATAFFLKFGVFSLSRQKALSLARFGTSLQACGLLSEEDVDEEIHKFTSLLEFPPRVEFEVSTGRYLGIPGANLYKLVGTQVRSDGASPFIVEETIVEQKAEVGL